MEITASDFKFKDHSAKVKSVVENAIQQGLTAMGEEQNSLWVQEITTRGVVDTGRFRASVSKKVTKRAVIVGSSQNDPPYPIYLEYGTYKMSARPTLGPSILNNKTKLKQAFSIPFNSIK